MAEYLPILWTSLLCYPFHGMGIHVFPVSRVAEHYTNKKVKQYTIYVALISQ